MDAGQTAQDVARRSYGRLVAMLAARGAGLAAAEDALADAFAAALATWPERGVPANPEAWLVTTARNRLSNTRRARRVSEAATGEILMRLGDAQAASEFPDERLKLLFVCAHPDIDPLIRTPLMLQTVLGLDAARIASAFAVQPAAMGQRLVRAKARIGASGLRFEVPDVADLDLRVTEVLEAIYGAYGTGWDAIAGADGDVKGLSGEAIYLGRLVAALLPDHPEPKGLLSLMLFCEARRPARFDAAGAFVPLAAQDARLWTRDLIIEADALLTLASRAGRFGRFQCEAAIQSVHVQRPIVGRLNHDAIGLLYRMLVAHAPTLGNRVGQAAATLDAGDPARALDQLDAIESDGKERYQPYWVTRRACLEALGRPDEAGQALERAIGLTEHPRLRAYLLASARPAAEGVDRAG